MTDDLIADDLNLEDKGTCDLCGTIGIPGDTCVCGGTFVDLSLGLADEAAIPEEDTKYDEGLVEEEPTAKDKAAESDDFF